MWKFVIFAAVAYFLYRMFVNDKKRKTDNEQKEKEQRIATGELVKDPACGTYVDSESTITVREGAVLHRFCSYECRDQFLATKQSLESDSAKIPDKNPDEQ